MTGQLRYKRALLKLSGEALLGDRPFGIDDAVIDGLAGQVEAALSLGVKVGVVERTRLFTDQTSATPETPSSIERIARAADEARGRPRRGRAGPREHVDRRDDLDPPDDRAVRPRAPVALAG